MILLQPAQHNNYRYSIVNINKIGRFIYMETQKLPTQSQKLLKILDELQARFKIVYNKVV